MRGTWQSKRCGPLTTRKTGSNTRLRAKGAALWLFPMRRLPASRGPGEAVIGTTSPRPTSNPDKVSCVYADNPGGNPEMMMKIGQLARQDVPLLEVCGSIDPLLGRYTLPIENIYQQFGGRISLMIKDGCGHHPHSLQDPKPIADFIEHSVQPTTNPPPT